ncbi:MAG: acetyl-CoA carboxylase, carboxyltransferase subunit beta [Candidatus Sumerlaeaceae bacterium]|nr:acetyl-CoA carboxylase, carboxyltransferase subunit beta [Candidatus Sumerlaeaceae bacterium]
MSRTILRPEVTSVAWFKKEKYSTLKPPQMRDRIPEGLLTKCDNCYTALMTKDLEENLRVCPKCGYHHRLPARERLALMTDPGSFREMFTNIQPTDALHFVDSKEYPERLKAARKCGFDEAVITGEATINGRRVAYGQMIFEFVGGSMGSVVGERITRLIEHATANQLPCVVVAASGGARMQEGILSLMQMAKTSGALARHAARRLPYLVILTDPSTAGVMASYASLGDVCIAEPGALIGFAGPRVIQQTINQILPKGFQRSEFVRDHGFVDIVVPRKDLKRTVALLLYYMTGQPDESMRAAVAEARVTEAPAHEPTGAVTAEA